MAGRVSSCARLKQWVEMAQPNARVEYARGYVLATSCTPELREYVMAVSQLGLITPHVIRSSGDVPVYIVQRTGRPVIKGQL
jgi:hypothetical protein